MLLQIDGTFIVIGASFIFFMLVMQVIFYRPMMQMKDQRKEYIEENQRHAKVMTEAAENFVQTQEKELKDTREASKEIVSKAAQEATVAKERTIKEAAEKANTAFVEAKQKIAQSKKQTRESLNNEVCALADDIVSRILD